MRFFCMHFVASRQKKCCAENVRRMPPRLVLPTAKRILSLLIAGQIGFSCQLILAHMRPFLTAVKLEPTTACSRVNITIRRLISQRAGMRAGGALPPCNVSPAASSANARPARDVTPLPPSLRRRSDLKCLVMLGAGPQSAGLKPQCCRGVD